jgi:hypothetical protein
MTPSRLNGESFSSYPTQGREIAVSHLRALQQTSLPVLPAFLLDLKEYDWKFPREQEEIVRRIDFLQKHPESVAGFRHITLSAAVEKLDCVDEPRRFLARMTAELWSSLQMDRYRQAAAEFMELYQTSDKEAASSAPRLVMVMIGQDAHPTGYSPFQRLRAHGQVRVRVNATGGAQAIVDMLVNRSARSPRPYAHWYLDGGSPLLPSREAGVTQLVYPALEPVNQRILERIMANIQSGNGPEVLQEDLGGLKPQQVSADRVTDDPRLQHFIVSLLTEGSGTQIFSTSFVQWAAREILRRAQPETLCVHFAPRQRQQSFNAMVLAASGTPELDPEGSLIDAEMGAYYTYLEMKKFPGAEEASFMVWFEGRSQVFIAGPGIPMGTTADSPVTMQELLSSMLSST